MEDLKKALGELRNSVASHLDKILTLQETLLLHGMRGFKVSINLSRDSGEIITNFLRYEQGIIYARISKEYTIDLLKDGTIEDVIFYSRYMDALKEAAFDKIEELKAMAKES